MKPSEGQVAKQDSQKYPKEIKHRCKSAMLQAINEMDNLEVNGSKDSQYNDLITFERMFNEWDEDAIILTEWSWIRDYKEPYVYARIIGVYTNINIFARKLQRVLSGWEKISVIMTCKELDILVYNHDILKDDVKDSHSFTASFMHMNQIDSGFHYDGWKFDLPTPPQPGKGEEV